MRQTQREGQNAHVHAQAEEGEEEGQEITEARGSPRRLTSVIKQCLMTELRQDNKNAGRNNMGDCCHELAALQQRVADQADWIESMEKQTDKKISFYQWVLGGVGAVGLILFGVIMQQTTSIKADVTCIRADVQTIGARFGDHLEQHDKAQEP